jgi:hypothetical protein
MGHGFQFAMLNNQRQMFLARSRWRKRVWSTSAHRFTTPRLQSSSKGEDHHICDFAKSLGVGKTLYIYIVYIHIIIYT